MKSPAKEFFVYDSGKWIPRLLPELSDYTTFADIKFNYANIIDYVRVLMCIIATFTITTEWHLLSAFLILGSILLDWIDGPIARAYNQCSILGSGIDWLADILGALTIALWWVKYDSSIIPWLFIATSTEVGTGLVDFSITATARYPKLKKGQSGFFVILEWSMPENQYNSLGTFLWLAYPFYCVFRILEHCYGYNDMIFDTEILYTSMKEWNITLMIFVLNRYILFIPAVMYIWCELAYGAHMFRSWIEVAKIPKPSFDEIVYDDATTSIMGGFIHYGILPIAHQKLLLDIYKDLQQQLSIEYRLALSQRKVFWINVWKRLGTNNGFSITFDNSTKLDELVRSSVCKYYDADDVILDGYGYILNPVGSEAQAFHLDYTKNYSTIFIPLTEISHNNAVQYVIPSPTTDTSMLNEAIKNPDFVDLNQILESGNYFSLRQCVTKPFSILKMDFGTIHRAISNQGTYDRLMFYISVIKATAADNTYIPDEPLFQSIDKVS